jgi:hypothetical protein
MSIGSKDSAKVNDFVKDEVSSMIPIRFQVFFFDPAAEDKDQLSAIKPIFTSPGAVKTLVRTAKYEKRTPVVFSGEQEDLDQLVQKVERLDSTDWLDLETDEKVNELKNLGEEMKLSLFDPSGFEEQPVLSDEEEVVASSSKSCPSFIPSKSEEHQALWLDVGKRYRGWIKKQPGPDEKLAAQIIIYKELAHRRHLVPFESITNQSSIRLKLSKDIEEGERKATEILNGLFHNAEDQGLVKRSLAMKHTDTTFDHNTSKYQLTHELAWVYPKGKNHWKELSKFLLYREAFKELGPAMLMHWADQRTSIEFFRAEDRAKIFIRHILTPPEAASLTDEASEDMILKKLNKCIRYWYSHGKFPDPEKI